MNKDFCIIFIKKIRSNKSLFFVEVNHVKRHSGFLRQWYIFERVRTNFQVLQLFAQRQLKHPTDFIRPLDGTERESHTTPAHQSASYRGINSGCKDRPSIRTCDSQVRSTTGGEY